MHKSQIFFILLLGFIGGVALGSFLEVPLTTIKFLFLPVLLTMGIFWRRKWKMVLSGLVALFFLFGLLRISDFSLVTTYVKKFADTNFGVTLSGYVGSESTMKNGQQHFIFRVRSLRTPDKFLIPENLDERVLVIADPFPARHYGDRLALTGKLKLPTNHQDFDYISYLARDQVFTIMFKPKIEATNPALAWSEKIKIGFLSKVYGLKNRFEEAISLAVTEPSASFLNGILLGSRQNIPADLKSDFSTAGLTHILAISGYNITIISEIVMWLLLFFFNRRLAFWFALGAVAVFTIMTGASASVVRSALMGALVLLANHSGRLYHSKNSLALVAFLMILSNPMILRYDVGFQLSFLATLGILYVAPLLQPYFKRWPSVFNFKETLAMTISAQLMVLPLIAFYFNQFSLVALPANLIVLPFIPLAMLLGFLTGLADLVWSGLGAVVGAAAWLVASAILGIIHFFAHLPYASLTISFPWLGILLAYLVIGYGLWQLKIKKRRSVDN